MPDPDRRDETEEDAAICAAALAHGDLALAAQRIASALRVDPLRVEWRETLERILDVASLDPERTSADVAQWLDDYADAPELSEEARLGLERLGLLLDRILSVHDEHLGLQLLGASTLRRLGRHGEAVKLARRAYELSPGWHTAACVAASHRGARSVDSAIVWYERALAHDAGELTARLDLGDMLAEARRPREAARWYREVLEIEPLHPWATASLCFVGWLEGSREDDLARLAELAGADPPNKRALMLLSELVRSGQPYVGYLPEPSDASIHFLRQVGDGLCEAKSVTLAVSSLEAPSARLAFDLYLADQEGHIDMQVDVQCVQEPDPRYPSAPVGYLLWEYEGTIPRPAVGPPKDAEVVEAVAALAKTTYDGGVWARRGAALATRFGRAGSRDLLRVMVHPPPAPPDVSSWQWIRRVQFAAMFAVAGLDDGWSGSLRREVLRSLLHGPMDWSVEAAIVVIGHLVQTSTEQQIERDALAWFLRLASRIPRPGHCCYEAAVLEQTLALGSLPDDLRETLTLRLQELLEPVEDD